MSIQLKMFGGETSQQIAEMIRKEQIRGIARQIVRIDQEGLFEGEEALPWREVYRMAVKALDNYADED